MMNKPFKPMRSRFRATFSGAQLAAAGSRLGAVDRKNEVLHDVQITLEGEALGHGVWLDRDFCEAVAAAGNETGDVGLKVRYGHPAMCSDAIGTELGRAKNFRVVDLEREIDGKKVKCAGVLADIHLLKSAHSAPQGDIATHVLEVAAEDPKQFGQSIVFTYADWVVKDSEGVRHSYKEEVGDPYDKWCAENPKADRYQKYAKEKELYDAWFGKSADEKFYAVLGKLHGSDFTDTPAATDGVFSAGSLAEEAGDMLDEHPQIREVILKSPNNVIEFLKRSDLFDAIAPHFESARVSGLQAAKDKEIGELNKRIEEMSALDAVKLAAEVESLKANLEKANAELSAKVAAFTDLESKHKSASDALADSNKSVEQLTNELATTKEALAKAEGDLAEAREHLSAWENHASGHGATVNTPPDGKAKFANFAAAVDALGYAKAAREYPDLKAGYRAKK